MLEMRDIRKAFGPTVALNGVSFSVSPGEVHALVGENGAGKSTLMKILSGAHAPDAGTMTLQGAPCAPRDPREARALGVGMIYQELSLAPHLTLTENIHLGRELRKGPWLDHAAMRAEAAEALERAGLPGIDPDTRAGHLSTAQAQQVEIARALASGCRVLVLDEPTSSLTRGDITRLFQLIRDWKSRGLAIIYISHFLEEVREIADTCTVLCDGRAVLTRPVAALTDAEIVRAMVGRDVDDLYPRSPRAPGEPLLEVDLPHASFQLHGGEILGISGLIGSGRTELLEEIFGLRPVRAGRVQVGTSVGVASPARRWRQGVGMLSEDRKRKGLALNLTVADNLTLTRLPGWSTPAGREEKASRWIQRLSIKCDGPASPVFALSGGNQQKVALGRLLHHDADVLLLDEPTRGIDVGAKALMYRVLDAWVSNADPTRGPRAALMVSSYLPELLGICDRIAVMRRGRLGPVRPVEAWSEHRLMEESVK